MWNGKNVPIWFDIRGGLFHFNLSLSLAPLISLSHTYRQTDMVPCPRRLAVKMAGSCCFFFPPSVWRVVWRVIGNSGPQDLWADNNCLSERGVSDQNVLNSLPGTIIQLLHSIRTSVIRRSRSAAAKIKMITGAQGGDSVFYKDEGQIRGMQKTNEVWHSEGKKHFPSWSCSFLQGRSETATAAPQNVVRGNHKWDRTTTCHTVTIEQHNSVSERFLEEKRAQKPRWLKNVKKHPNVFCVRLKRKWKDRY